jgi:NAD+ synthase (glutamine-hydrolysing)
LFNHNQTPAPHDTLINSTHPVFYRTIAKSPYVSDDASARDEDCYEAFNIQVSALIGRLEATNVKNVVIGISGGLDSTHALLVTSKAFDRLNIDRKNIHGYTMPGFGTSNSSKNDALKLMTIMGISSQTLDIRPSARRMLLDIDHPFAQGKPHYDIVFENVQAGLRTDYLFRLAGQKQGFVIGTGDLSELAMGWCTYGVGDHMSHYNVNCGAPKTLIKHLVRWAATHEYDTKTAKILHAIVSREISPELIPIDEDGNIQKTEDKVGPYVLVDFFLFYITRYGLKPSKVAFLAYHAFEGVYDLDTIVKWLEVFLWRFFQSTQYKRSAVPNGPKLVAGGSLSPRGDWRAPSDSKADMWIEELRSRLQ